MESKRFADAANLRLRAIGIKTPFFRVVRGLIRLGYSRIDPENIYFAISHSLIVSRLWLNTPLAMNGSLVRNLGWPTRSWP